MSDETRPAKDGTGESERPNRTGRSPSSPSLWDTVVELAGLPASMRISVGGAESSEATLKVPAGAPADPAVGPRLGRYEVLKRLGRGGMGEVVLVRDPDLNRDLAAKVIRRQVDLSRRDIEKFLIEAQVTGQLEHPNIVPVHELGVSPEGRLYFTMKRVRGQDLAAVLAELPADSRAGRLAHLLTIFLKVADAIAFAHSRGVIHRDLKPANIMVGEFGEVLVMDWGLAKLRNAELGTRNVGPESGGERGAASSDPMQTSPGTVMGTPAYMPPEQAAGEVERIDERSDIYSLGAILYEILAGVPAYSRGDVKTLLARVATGRFLPPSRRAPPGSVPRELEAVVLKAMAREREARYASVLEFRSDIEAFLTGHTLAAARYSPFQRVAKWVGRHKGVSAVGTVGALLVAFFIAWLAVERSRALEERKRALDKAHDEQIARADADQSRERARREEGRARSEADRASARERTARAWALTTAAREALEEGRALLSLLLAREACRIDRIPEAQQALRDALNARSFELGIFAAPREFPPILSRQGDMLLSGSAHGTARLWDLAGRDLATFAGHEGSVSCAFSPDGTRIATAGEEGTARIFDLGGRELAVLAGHEAAIEGISFTPDGERIVTASSDATARLWSMDGRELAVLLGHEGPVASAIVSPDGARIATVSHDGTARLWGSDGRELGILCAMDPNAQHILVAFSPDGSRILVTGGASARLVDAEGRELATLADHMSWTSAVAFSPDGSAFATGSEDGLARVWDREGRTTAVLLGHTSGIRGIEFSPDGKRILTASLDRTGRLWSPDGSSLAVLAGHEAPVFTAAFLPGGDRALTFSTDGTVRLWDLETGEVPTHFGRSEPLACAVFSPDGERVVTAGAGGTARIWDLHARRIASLGAHTGQITGLEFSRDGGKIVTSSLDRTARLWTADGAELTVLRGHEHWVFGASFSPDGSRIATASADKTVRLWDAGGREIATLSGHTGPVYSARWSPDGKRIVTASADGTARLWDLEGRDAVVLQHQRGTQVRDADFSPEGTRVLTAEFDRAAHLWDLDGRELAAMRGHEGFVFTARFSPDGTRIVTAGADRTARLWDLEGRELAILRAHAAEVVSAVFSPDGKRILTASQDGTARLWHVAFEDLLAAADQKRWRELTPTEAERFRSILSEEAR